MGKASIKLSCPHTCRIKNSHVVCCTLKTLYDVLSQLFLIHSFFYTLDYTFNCLYTFLCLYIYFQFFILLLPDKYTYAQLKPQCVWHFTNISFICICSKEYRRCYDFVYQFFDAIVFLNMCSKLCSMVLLNCKKSNWFIDFIFYIDIA